MLALIVVRNLLNRSETIQIDPKQKWKSIRTAEIEPKSSEVYFFMLFVLPNPQRQSLTMATTPSTKLYSVVAVAIRDEDDADEEGVKKISTAPLMIESAEERREEVWQWEREREGERRWESRVFKLVMASMFVISLIVVGGKEYHYKTYYLSSDINDTKNNQEILAEDKDGGNDYFVPLTADEREEMKEMLRTTLRETKHALLSSTVAGNQRALQQSPQRTLVLDSDLPKQFMHMHHMKTGKRI